MTKKKASLFVHDLSGNPIVRAYPFGKALEAMGYEVEILGLTYNTDEIYEPYKDAFNYKTIRSYLDIRWVIINSRKLAKMATGDIVFAFKPVWGSFFPALIYSGFGIKRKLILDAEDNELYDTYIGNGWKNLFKNKFYPINPVYNKILHPLTFLVKRKTVVCESLRKRYGGTIILHGPDHQKFNPVSLPSRDFLLNKFQLSLENKYLIFAGRPLFYNGLPYIVKALTQCSEDWHLLLVGNSNDELFVEAKKTLGNRCHLLGYQKNSDMPEMLQMADIAPIIQSRNRTTKYQIPAKLLEALCMGKPIIGSDICDIPKIVLPHNGWIVNNENPEEMAKLLDEILRDKQLLIEKGENGREYFIQHASIEVIINKLKKVLQ